MHYLIAFLLSVVMPMQGTARLQQESIAHAEGERFLVTYPRSGTNMTSCYIQSLIKCPIEFLFAGSDGRIAENRLNLELDDSKPVLYRTHRGYLLKPVDSSKNKLLLVLRNYKECITRTKIAHDMLSKGVSDPYKNPRRTEELFSKSDELDLYISNLRLYHKWDPAQRLLVYYEDLIENPEKEILRILQFFKESIPDYFSQDFLETIRTRTLESYHQQRAGDGGSISRGEDVEFHSKKYSPETRHKIDESIKASYPVLWELYLKRYNTKI